MKKYIFTLLCMLACVGAAAQDRLYINDFSIDAGETKTVEIQLDNATTFTALQADIYLPEGLSIEQEDGEYLFDLTDRKARNHTISSTLLSSGAVRILIASQTVKEISGNSGALVTFNIIADASLSGTKTIELRNVVATTPQGIEHQLPATTCTVTGPGGGEEPPVTGDDRLYINDFSIAAGETKTVEIQLDNATTFTALQADIYLPDGLSIEQEDGEYLFDLTDRKARNHTISSTLLSSGAVRILIASQTVKEISGNSGALVTFNIIADASLSGTKTIELRNVVATTTQGIEHQLPATTCTVTASGGSVTPPDPQPEGVALNTTMARLQLGETLQLVNTTGAAVTWTSSNPAAVAVDANGLVTALSNGMAAITATDAHGRSQWCAVWSYQRGDLNGDGKVDVEDVNIDINIILGK
ncbi:MAG: Ig-like domain-containing protein [Muribaculaceae bacterium]|nr:Ig-like domain-containing protein [Muribaculaceae bacterium]